MHLTFSSEQVSQLKAYSLEERDFFFPPFFSFEVSVFVVLIRTSASAGKWKSAFEAARVKAVKEVHVILHELHGYELHGRMLSPEAYVLGDPQTSIRAFQSLPALCC